MKKFIMLFIAFLAMIYAEIKTNRIHDAMANNPSQEKSSTKLDYLLARIDYLARPLAIMSSEQRFETRRMVLKIIDFNRPMAQRQNVVRQLLRMDDLSKEEEIVWETRINTALLLLDRIGQKAPIGLKMVVTAAVNLITSDKYLFAIHELRDLMVLEEIMKIHENFQENPDLAREFQDIQHDLEIKLLAKKAFGVHF